LTYWKGNALQSILQYGFHLFVLNYPRLYHFLKTQPGKEHAPLIGFIGRIVKLLFFSIKPVFVFDGPAPMLKRKTLAGRSNKRKAKKEMEIETEFALFSKKIKLNSLNPTAANEETTAAPEVEEIVHLNIPKRDPRFATHRELSAFVAENQDEATEDDFRVLKVQEAHDRILNEKRRYKRILQKDLVGRCSITVWK
jgi:5'-3' exonuclease